MMCNTTSTIDDASPPTDVPAVLAMTEMTESASIDGVGVEEEEEEKENANANAQVNAALNVLLKLNLNEKIQAQGGYYALVSLRNCRDKEIGRISASDEITESTVQRSSNRFRNILTHFVNLALLFTLVAGAGGYVWYHRWLEAQGGVTRAPCDSALPTTSSSSCEIPKSGFPIVEDQEEEKLGEEYLEGVGKLIQDLAHSDNAKVNTALDALYLDFNTDRKKVDTFTAWGGCAALVHLLKDRLKSAIKKIPQCDQVTELHELPELKTVEITLRVIVNLTHYSKMARSGMVAVGGVEAVVKAMKTFPNCLSLQDWACAALGNLAYGNATGKKQAIESGGIELLLAAVNNHLGSSLVCEAACWALYNIVVGSKENTDRLINLGGGAAVEKVNIKWADNKVVQALVEKLASIFVAGWKARSDLYAPVDY
jgi:hypothetical protein